MIISHYMWANQDVFAASICPLEGRKSLRFTAQYLRGSKSWWFWLLLLPLYYVCWCYYWCSPFSVVFTWHTLSHSLKAHARAPGEKKTFFPHSRSAAELVKYLHKNDSPAHSPADIAHNKVEILMVCVTSNAAAFAPRARSRQRRKKWWEFCTGIYGFMARSITLVSCFSEIRFAPHGSWKKRRLKTHNADKFAVCFFCSLKVSSKEEKLNGFKILCPSRIAICRLWYFFSPHSLSDVKYEQSHGMTCMWICYFWCFSKCQPICYVVTESSHIPCFPNIYSARGKQALSTLADHFNYESGYTPLLAHVTNKWDFREERECSGRLNISSDSALLLQHNIHRVERPVRVNALQMLHLWAEWLYIDWECFQEVGKHANMQLDAAHSLGPALYLSLSIQLRVHQFNFHSTQLAAAAVLDSANSQWRSRRFPLPLGRTRPPYEASPIKLLRNSILNGSVD